MHGAGVVIHVVGLLGAVAPFAAGDNSQHDQRCHSESECEEFDFHGFVSPLLSCGVTPIICNASRSPRPQHRTRSDNIWYCSATARTYMSRPSKSIRRASSTSRNMPLPV